MAETTLVVIVVIVACAAVVILCYFLAAIAMTAIAAGKDDVAKIAVKGMNEATQQTAKNLGSVLKKTDADNDRK